LIGERGTQELQVERLLLYETRRISGREIGGKQCFHLQRDLGSTNIEPANVDEANDAEFVQEDAVGYHVEIEQTTQYAGAVDNRCERGGVRLCVRSRSLGVSVDGDAQESEGVALSVLLDELLPHGQLRAASSPAGPHKDECALAAQALQRKRLTIQAAQDEVRHGIANLWSAHRSAGCGRIQHWVGGFL